MELDNIFEQIKSLIKSAVTPKVAIIKSVEETNEHRRALFVAMEPEVEDAHGDITSAEEIEKACHDFNKHCGIANLFHVVETQSVDIQESFIAMNDMQMDSGREITKGTWLMWMHFPKDNPESDVIWDLVKSGDINGISIGGRGIKTEITE